MPVKIPLSVDQQQLLNELIKQRDSWGKIENAVKDLGKTADKEEKNRLRQAKAIIRSQRDEQEVLADKIAVLRRVGREDETQKAASNRAIKRLIKAERDRVDGVQDAARKASTAYKEEQRLIDAGVKKVGQLKTANQSLEQQHNELKVAIKAAFKAGKIGADEYERSLNELEREHDELKAKQKSTFGSGAQQSVAAYAASFLSITAAIAVVTKAIQFFNEEKEKALGQTETLQDARRSLRQISKGDFDQLESRADDLTKFGISREKARGLVFDARSTGFEGEESTVAAADPVINISDGAAFAGEFRKFFSDDNLSIEQAFNTALAGAAESKLNITGLLPQIRTASQGALAGGESSDLVAATSILADNFGQSVGDRLRALGTKLATNEQTKGLNLIDAVAKLQASPELRESIQKDSSELKAVITKFIDRTPEIVNADKRIEAEQRKSGSGGLLGKALGEALDKNTLSGRREVAFRESVAAEARNQIATENTFSEGASKSRSAFNDAKTDAIGLGVGGRLAAASAAGVTSTFSSNERFIKGSSAAAGLVTSGGGGFGNLGLVKALRDAIVGQTKSLEGIEKNTRTEKSKQNVTVEGI